MLDRPIASDQIDRDRAVRELERNVVVLAGAGTGKTTLLIDRLTLLILGRGVPVERIVALTFTKKAAEEMRVRLEDRLRMAVSDVAAIPLFQACGNGQAQEWALRAAAALEAVPKAQIGTIHSFAGHLLRLYPVQGRVDPSFREDQGDRFEMLFDEHWALWAATELSGSEAGRAQDWAQALAVASMADLRDLAKAMCIPDPISPVLDNAPPLAWVGEQARLFLELSRRHPVSAGAPAFSVGMEALGRVFSAVSSGRAVSDDDRSAIDALRRPPAKWSGSSDPDALSALKRFRSLGESLGGVDAVALEAAVRVVRPFATHFMEQCRRQGLMSFDALLAHARRLLRDHPEVRRQLKNQYETFLVDEFQDTDPLQGEILFYLAEEPGEAAPDWRSVSLSPGRLFVVGDPKQSIYRFRGADIAAFEAFEREMVAQGALQVTLRDNFRSRPALLSTVNGVFDRMMVARPGLQPAYAALQAARSSTGDAALGVFFIDGEPDAEEAREREAVMMADWVAEHAGPGKKHRFEDVAILFRSTNAFQPYVDALRRRAIPYLAEGEKSFYRTYEVSQLLCLLRAVSDPADKVSLVGVLRSAYGGLSDPDILALKEMSGFDYRVAPPLFESKLGALFEVLNELNRMVSTQPLLVALDAVIDRFNVLELAAAARFTDQTLANLFKIRHLAAKWSESGPISFADFVERLDRHREDEREEGESPLADSHFDAVRLMTIHKAKGLEFPVVFLANLSAGKAAAQENPLFRRDWETGWEGLRLPRARRMNAAMAVLDDLTALREREEEVRVLYVAMTRAKERLFLALRAKPSAGSFADGLMSHIPVWPAPGVFRLEWFGSDVEVVTESASGDVDGDAARPAPSLSVARLASLHRRRAAELEKAAYPHFVAPSSLLSEPETDKHHLRSDDDDEAREYAMDLGVLCHAVLEEWDFGTTAGDRPARLEEGLARAFRREGMTALSPGFGRLEGEARQLLSSFLAGSEAARLAAVRILGRETPLLSAGVRASSARPLRGIIDLVYEDRGQLVIADYKTTRTSGRGDAAWVEHYRGQGRAYVEALEKAVGRPPLFELIFLRESRSIRFKP